MRKCERKIRGKWRKKEKKENEDKNKLFWKKKKDRKVTANYQKKRIFTGLKKKIIKEKNAKWQKHVLPQYIFPACK